MHAVDPLTIREIGSDLTLSVAVDCFVAFTNASLHVAIYELFDCLNLIVKNYR